MVIRRVGPLSAGKVLGVMYVGFGLLAGAIVSLLSVVGAVFAGASDEGIAGVIFGVGAIIILPVFYGILGFVGGALGALFYNAVSSVVGGIEVDLQQ